MAGKNGGPWGGGGKNSGEKDDAKDGRSRPQRPTQDTGIPELDDFVRRGRDQLNAIMGGRGGGEPPKKGSSDGLMPMIIAAGGVFAVIFWVLTSFYSVRPEEKSVELFLGQFSEIGEPGLNFAPWPLVTAEVVPVSNERTQEIGTGRSGSDAGLMLTGDENVVDIDFQVVWNITEPDKFLFNLADPEQTIAAVSESAMREIIAQSELATVRNRDRGVIQENLRELIQETLDSYDAGVNIVRVNFDRADPPQQVIDAFRDVQAAEQERDQLRNQADAYANRVTAQARGEVARILEDAEAYRARVVNEAQGEASRFDAVLTEFEKAPEVTRKRLYLETMEEVLGRVDKIILDETGSGSGGQGVVPYLPLNELRRNPTGGAN